MKFVLLVFLLVGTPYAVDAFVEGLYCGVKSCYEVLGVERTATVGEIKKIYRKLARDYHPDRNKEEGAADKFQLIATAYEVLKDEEQRRDYDYMLDNPEEAYYHYYQYYKRRLTPKVDVRIVLAVTITIISVLQYLQKQHSYDEAVRFAMQSPKFRNKALQIIHREGLFLVQDNKKKNKRNKDEKKKEEERILKEIVEDSIEIKGSYSKPTYRDTLWVQLFRFPYSSVVYGVWLLNWAWKFWIKKEEYGEVEKEYLTYRNLNLSQQYWNALDEYSRESYMKKELWNPENAEKYHEKQEEEYRIKMAENGKHKMWRRFMKRGGPGQMTFADE